MKQEEEVFEEPIKKMGSDRRKDRIQKTTEARAKRKVAKVRRYEEANRNFNKANGEEY